MPEHLKALVIICVVAVTIFITARRALAPCTMSVGDYQRRTSLWLSVTLIAFLAHSFWLYVLLCGLLILIAGRREHNPLALYCLLLFAVPSYNVDIPGFGLIEFLFTINHTRLLNITLLLPFAITLAGRVGARPQALRRIDALLFVYCLYLVLKQVSADSLTGNMRFLFYLLLDMVLPYYVASRSLRKVSSFLEAISCLLLSLAIMAVIAAFEASKSWLLYTGLNSALGLPPPPSGFYLFRDEGGFLRAIVTTEHAIILGYLMMVGLVLLIFLGPKLKSNRTQWIAFLVIGAGALASFSRGPWVGATIGLSVALALGPNGVRRVAFFVAGLVAILAALLVSPYDNSVIKYIPFMGDFESSSVDYRQMLLDVSMQVFWQSPVFGQFGYIDNPLMEQMRQGQGIIDMVNSYLVIALAYGLIGLTLFVTLFAYALYSCWMRHRALTSLDGDLELLGRSLIGMFVGILVTIATVSSIGVIPAVYWMMLGFLSAFSCLDGRSIELKATVSKERDSRAAVDKPVVNPLGQIY